MARVKVILIRVLFIKTNVEIKYIFFTELGVYRSL